MKTALTLVAACMYASAWCHDLSIELTFPNPNKALKANSTVVFATRIVREDEENSGRLPFVIYYQWNDEAPEVFQAGGIFQDAVYLNKELKTPNNVGQMAAFKIYLVCETDTNASNDSLSFDIQLADRFQNDFSVGLTKPGKQANVTAGKPYPVQFKLTNIGLDTFKRGQRWGISGNLGNKSLFSNQPNLKYLDGDIPPGDSILFDYIVIIPDDARLIEAPLCFRLYWVERHPEFAVFVNVETDVSNNEACIAVNAQGVGTHEAVLPTKPQIQYSNGHLSYSNSHKVGSQFQTLSVFDLSGKLLFNQSITSNNQQWTLHSNQSVVLVVLSGQGQTHRQILSLRHRMN